MGGKYLYSKNRVNIIKFLHKSSDRGASGLAGKLEKRTIYWYVLLDLPD
jgi:hypothetical protein